jgi:hypothetical protein
MREFENARTNFERNSSEIIKLLTKKPVKIKDILKILPVLQ